jgi:hypothetical protein
MKAKYFVVAVVVALSLSWEARSDDTQLRTRALRQARRIARTSPAGEVSTMTNTNFAGVWGGRYIYSSRGSTCGTRLTSFQFRHLLLTRGSSGSLSTNHDGDFGGRSRDRGRRWEFAKGISAGGRPGVLVIVYQSLARNGNTAATGAAVSVGGCTVAYGANAIRLAR